MPEPEPDPPLCDPEPLGLFVLEPDDGDCVAPPLLCGVEEPPPLGVTGAGGGVVTAGVAGTVLAVVGVGVVAAGAAGALATTRGGATCRFFTFSAGAACTGARPVTLTGLTLTPAAGAAWTAGGIALCVAKALVSP